jgi:hypothetical protein
MGKKACAIKAKAICSYFAQDRSLQLPGLQEKLQISALTKFPFIVGELAPFELGDTNVGMKKKACLNLKNKSMVQSQFRIAKTNTEEDLFIVSPEKGYLEPGKAINLNVFPKSLIHRYNFNHRLLIITLKRCMFIQIL